MLEAGVIRIKSCLVFHLGLRRDSFGCLKSSAQKQDWGFPNCILILQHLLIPPVRKEEMFLWFSRRVNGLISQQTRQKNTQSGILLRNRAQQSFWQWAPPAELQTACAIPNNWANLGKQLLLKFWNLESGGCGFAWGHHQVTEGCCHSSLGPSFWHPDGPRAKQHWGQRAQIKSVSLEELYLWEDPVDVFLW